MKFINACLCFLFAGADSVGFHSNVFAALYIELADSHQHHTYHRIGHQKSIVCQLFFAKECFTDYNCFLLV